MNFSLMSFKCKICGFYVDDGDPVDMICLRCIDNNDICCDNCINLSVDSIYGHNFCPFDDLEGLDPHKYKCNLFCR